MYTVTRFFWPGGFPGALITCNPKLPFFFLEGLRVEMFQRRGHFSLSFRGGGPGGGSLSDWHDFFVSLAPVLGSKGWIGYKREKVYSFDMCLDEGEEKDNAFLMEKYVGLLQYCRVDLHASLAPRIVRETYMGEGADDPKKIPVGPYLFQFLSSIRSHS